MSILSRPTLVLNKHWSPINVSPVNRVLILLWTDSARVVDPTNYQTYDWSDWTEIKPEKDEPFIQAVTMKIKAPEVITLNHYDGYPTATVTFSRRNVHKRDKYTCQYCGIQPGTEELTIDHVTPRAQGGISSWTNCVLACLPCNKKKADRTPEQAKMKLRKKPTRPKWRPAYAATNIRIESWSKFISEAYWNVPLET